MHRLLQRPNVFYFNIKAISTSTILRWPENTTVYILITKNIPNVYNMWYVDMLIGWCVDMLATSGGFGLAVSKLDCQGMARDGRDCWVLTPWTDSTCVNWVRATRACGTRAMLARILCNWGCKGFRAVGFGWMDELREIEYMGYKLKSITLSSQNVLIYGTMQGRAMPGCD